MSRYRFRVAQQSDSRALVRLFGSTPQEGQVVLNFEREPDYFIGNQVTTSDPLVFVCEDKETGDIVGCNAMGSRWVYVNGERQKIRYAGDLRIDPAHRNGRILVGLYRIAQKHLQPGEWVQTAILEDNDLSINTIAQGRASLPSYYPHGRLTSYLIDIPRNIKIPDSDQMSVRTAQTSDVQLIQTFFDEHAPTRQLYPVYDFQRLVDGDPYYAGLSIEDYLLCFSPGEQLMGVVGTWDQKSFKQTRLVEFRGITKFIRHAYNAYSKLRGGLTLPEAGGVLNYQSLHSLLIVDDEINTFRYLLHHAMVRLKQCGTEALIVAMLEDDPLRSVLESFRHRKTYTLHFLASYDVDPRKELDGRRLYLDVGRL